MPIADSLFGPSKRPLRYRPAVEESDGLWWPQVWFGNETIWKSSIGYTTDHEAMTVAQTQAAVEQVLRGGSTDG